MSNNAITNPPRIAITNPPRNARINRSNNQSNNITEIIFNNKLTEHDRITRIQDLNKAEISMLISILSDQDIFGNKYFLHFTDKNKKIYISKINIIKELIAKYISKLTPEEFNYNYHFDQLISKLRHKHQENDSYIKITYYIDIFNILIEKYYKNNINNEIYNTIFKNLKINIFNENILPVSSTFRTTQVNQRTICLNQFSNPKHIITPNIKQTNMTNHNIQLNKKQKNRFRKQIENIEETIKITIQNATNNKTIRLTVKKTDKISSIKSHIFTNFGITPNNIQIYYNDQIIKQPETMLFSEFNNNNNIVLKVKDALKKIITIKYRNKSINLEVLPKIRISAIKIKIKDKIKNIDNLQFYFNNELLDGNSTIENIEDGSVFELRKINTSQNNSQNNNQNNSNNIHQNSRQNSSQNSHQNSSQNNQQNNQQNNVIKKINIKNIDLQKIFLISYLNMRSIECGTGDNIRSPLINDCDIFSTKRVQYYIPKNFCINSVNIGIAVNAGGPSRDFYNDIAEYLNNSFQLVKGSVRTRNGNIEKVYMDVPYLDEDFRVLIDDILPKKDSQKQLNVNDKLKINLILCISMFASSYFRGNDFNITINNYTLLSMIIETYLLQSFADLLATKKIPRHICDNYKYSLHNLLKSDNLNTYLNLYSTNIQTKFIFYLINDFTTDNLKDIIVKYYLINNHNNQVDAFSAIKFLYNTHFISKSITDSIEDKRKLKLKITNSNIRIKNIIEEFIDMLNLDEIRTFISFIQGNDKFPNNISIQVIDTSGYTPLMYHTSIVTSLASHTCFKQLDIKFAYDILDRNIDMYSDNILNRERKDELKTIQQIQKNTNVEKVAYYIFITNKDKTIEMMRNNTGYGFR